VQKNTELKSTIQLPKTKFSMKANLPKREPEILDWWDDIGLDGKIQAARKGGEPFVLHDGPPYANAQIHLGQALNKTLKDFVAKSRSMMGHDVLYVPGWDCHGQPIEHRVDKDLGEKKATMHPLQIRARCRRHAEKYIDVQRKAFRRIGVFWDRATDAAEEKAHAPSRKAIYRTIDRTYEAEIVRQLGKFFTAGGVTHGVKPVHWCYSCQTALAEAEVEHQERKDPSIYVKFPIRGAGARIAALEGEDVSVVIWTTTPWTLPANLAVALHPELPYVAVRVDGGLLIVAEGLLSATAEQLGWTAPEIVARFSGSELVGEGDDWVGTKIVVERPYKAASGPAANDGVLILGDHVTLDAGTGCVHTAPGHGADDFIVGNRYDLEPYNPVGNDGHYLADRVGESWLGGEFVLKANKAILADLKERGLLLHHEDHEHSYPHCWRCHNPLLFRATPQWFISMDANDLRSRAIREVRATRWTPDFGEERIAKMIENRPDWCISRQRTWGVPIPAVVCEHCQDSRDDGFVRDAAFFDHVAALFLEEGSDAWFGVPTEEGRFRPYEDENERLERMLPAGVGCGACGKRDGLVVHDHIVDVWFESGVSHAAVLGHQPRLPWPADVYLEGHDQYRGWFQSSLLVAVNDRDKAPYREVLTHGFTLDSNGRKMSKSLGNVVSPLEIADKRGAEILRLWVSAIDFLNDMKMSEEVVTQNAEAYRKMRNTFRFMLGNLAGFDAERHAVPYDEMPEIDRWALQQMEQMRQRWIEAYRSHQYHTIYHGFHNFCGGILSSFYFDILKDRLYTLPPRDMARRSAQTVLWRLVDAMARMIAPVLCFTSEEIWQELQSLQGRTPWENSSVHAQTFPDTLEAEEDRALLDRWERLRGLREEVNKALEQARQSDLVKATLAATITIEADAATQEFLQSFGDELHHLFITSGVAFGKTSDGAFSSTEIDGLRVEVAPAAGEKCARCWHFTEDVGGDADWPEACARCVTHVRRILDDLEPA